MINLDIALNQKQNKKQSKKNDPLGTAGGFNIAQELEEIGLNWVGEDEDNENEGIINLDYELSHMQTPLPKNMPPQGTQPQPEEYEPGNLSGVSRFVANVTSSAADFGGVTAISPFSRITGWLAGAVDENQDESRKKLEYFNVPQDKMRSLWNGENIIENADKALLGAGATYKQWSDNTSQWINGTEPTEIDKVARGAGSTFGFVAGHAINHAIAATVAAPFLAGSPLLASLVYFGMVGALEASVESENFRMEKYAKDPANYKKAREVANMMFIPNAIADAGLDVIGGKISGMLPVKGFGKKAIKDAFGETLKENIQEGYQSATEVAGEETYQSDDTSWSNFGRNLIGEYRKMLPYTDEQSNQHSGYLWEQMPEVTASTLLSTAGMRAWGLPNPRQRGHIFTKKGRQTMVENSLKEDLTGHRDIYKGEALTNDEDLLGILMPPDSNEDLAQESYERLKKRRDELQARIEQLNNAYTCTGDKADINDESISEYERELLEVDNQIENVSNIIKSWNNVGVVTNAVQDDAMDFYPDMRLNVPAEPPEEKAQQSQNLPPIVDVDEIRQDMQEGSQSQSTQTHVNEPDLLPDKPRRRTNADTS